MFTLPPVLGFRYAFVRFRAKEDAAEALAMHGQFCGSSRMRVVESTTARHGGSLRLWARIGGAAHLRTVLVLTTAPCAMHLQVAVAEAVVTAARCCPVILPRTPTTRCCSSGALTATW